jgi:hypothetical protein
MNDYIQIQMEQGLGRWLTCSTVINNSQFIAHSMRNPKKIYPDKRIQAVDRDGRLIDTL